VKPISYAIGIFLMGAVITLLSVYLYWLYWGHRGVTADEVQRIVNKAVVEGLAKMAAPPVNVYGDKPRIYVYDRGILVREGEGK